ncbi:hypothetical protein [Pedobacter sp. GSP4]
MEEYFIAKGILPSLDYKENKDADKLPETVTKKDTRAFHVMARIK